MSGARTAAAGLPVVEAVRTKAGKGPDEAVWVVRRCVFCRRRHSHAADPVATEMIVPASCNPSRFYRLQEAVSR